MHLPPLAHTVYADSRDPNVPDTFKPPKQAEPLWWLFSLVLVLTLSLLYWMIVHWLKRPKKHAPKKIKTGFSLIELLIVIAIIGNLAGLIISSVTNLNTRVRDTQRYADAHAVLNALSIYQVSNPTKFPCHNYSDSADTNFMQPLIDQGYISKKQVTDPTNDNGLFYQYRTYKKSITGPCGQIVEFAFYTERPVKDCPSQMKIAGEYHCHLLFPIPLPCSDPYVQNSFPPDCQNLADNSSQDAY